MRDAATRAVECASSPSCLDHAEHQLRNVSATSAAAATLGFDIKHPAPLKDTPARYLNAIGVLALLIGPSPTA